ncbi:MAG TPA: ATP12 family protein [Alphaproteobacteria bacterium]
MKRFYKDVATGPALDGGLSVLLDNRPVRTPGKSLLTAPTESMAQVIADEWRAQGDLIVPQTMPITTLLTTCIDRTIPERQPLTETVLSYLNSDLLCYRVPDDETGLHQEQNRLWSPWLTWFAGRFGHRLDTTTLLAAFSQADDAHRDISAYISSLGGHQFNVLQVATALTGSIVLALALTEQSITADQTYACVLCEELFYERTHKLEQHGLDPIEEKRRTALKDDLNACIAYLHLLD